MAKGNYVDGYVVPVPKKKVKEYQKMAQKAAKIWKKYGALQYMEAVADDVTKGKTTSFLRSVKAKPNETVVFAFITYKSRADRDRINKKVMKDPAMNDLCDPKNLPFDAWRMFWGGFKPIVQA